MKIYGITVPIAGMAYIEIEADSEESAKEQALHNINIDHIEEWEPYENIVEGNLLHAPYNSIDIKEV